MGHIKTDQDIGLVQDCGLQRISLPKVVKLLTDPHSAGLHDRHIIALKKVVKHYSDGILMKDLVLIFKLLNVCADAIADVPAYGEPMSELLQLCGQPYLKEKTSDEFAYEQIAVECTDQLGYLMRVPSNRLRLQICDALRTFYCETSKSDMPKDKYKPNSLTYNQKLVDKSNIAETLVKSLALLEDDLEVKLAVLDLLQRLSSKSTSNCDRMLNANAAQQLCCRLMDHGPTHQLMFRSVEIIWNLMENCSNRDQLAEQLNDLQSISQLRDSFIFQLTQGYSNFDRQLRNDLLVISSLAASVSTDLPFIQSGFAKQLTLLTTFQEVKSHNMLVKHLKLMPSHEDFELKKLLINIIVLLSRDPSIFPLYSEQRVILALFSYVQANECCCPKLPSRDWTAAQYEEIQLHVLAALCTLAPLMIDDYLACQGGTRLLLMLEWCVGNDDYSGFGNAFHATGGYGSKKAHMRHCLRLLRSIVSTHDERVLNDLTEQGILGQLVSTLEEFSCGRFKKKECKMDDIIDIEMQCDLLVISSIVCQMDIHRKELFGGKGISVLTDYLKMDLNLLNSGLGHHRLLLCAIQCVWCTVIGSYLMEECFLEKEGVFLLIDLLESCPRSIHNQLLGCLLDLMENQKTLSHVRVWRGKQNVSAAHLFCELWRDEERHMGVCRDASGVISDGTRPLSGRLQYMQSTVSLPASCPSLAIVDVSENIRAKLYAIFSKIGFVELPGLTTDDHVTLTIVEHYLDFKAGEVWNEVLAELEVENIRPITPDKEAVEAISTAIHIRTEQVQQAQCELLEAQKQQDIMDEHEVYAQIRENHRQHDRECKKFTELVARTSKHSVLKAAKDRQALSIEASRSRKVRASSATFHSTELPKLNVTAFCRRHVTINSTRAAASDEQQ